MIDQINTLLRQVTLPLMQQDVVTSRVLRKISDTHGVCTLDLVFGFPIATLKDAVTKQLQQTLQGCAAQVVVTCRSDIKAHAVQPNVGRLPSVKNVIAVASGKGGVGKSTVAANLALALHQTGARVGVLDADIYGPSVPMMLGATSRPKSIDNKYLEPVDCYGVQTISMGYMIEQDDTPMVWRGPMVSKALQQLMGDTLWQDVDYLLIDLPPGTGDIQLTLAQKIPLTAALVVTTPQDIALLDARKAVRMFEKVNIPVLGVVENMGMHVCPQCGHQQAIFGAGGAEKMAQQYQLDMLGSLPLDKRIREASDGGQPIALTAPESELARSYQHMALQAVANLSMLPRDYSASFPKIVVKNEG